MISNNTNILDWKISTLACEWLTLEYIFFTLNSNIVDSSDSRIYVSFYLIFRNYLPCLRIYLKDIGLNLKCFKRVYLHK